MLYFCYTLSLCHDVDKQRGDYTSGQDNIISNICSRQSLVATGDPNQLNMSRHTTIAVTRLTISAVKPDMTACRDFFIPMAPK
jgi:hypothetical protein